MIIINNLNSPKGIKIDGLKRKKQEHSLEDLFFIYYLYSLLHYMVLPRMRKGKTEFSITTHNSLISFLLKNKEKGNMNKKSQKNS